jgi:alkylation response protein AidB-like acyl-CoA dehydrogenase
MGSGVPIASDTRADIVAMVADFAAREVAPTAAERDAEGGYSPELWQKMADVGLHGLAIPQERGGAGLDMPTICAAGQAFGRHGQDFGLGLSWLSSMYVTAVPILELGTEDQIAAYVPALLDGRLIGSQAITEPQAGSDVGAIRTTARRDGDEWVLNGSKIFISNAPLAGVFLVLAVTDPEAGRGGLSLFIVEADTPGLEVGPAMKKMGSHASPTAEVFLDDCRVPADALLGTPGRGFFGFLRSASSERLVLTALLLGVLEACVDRALVYAREREQFGRPIGEFQAIRMKLADMRVAVDAGEGLIDRAAAVVEAGHDARIEISAAKLFVSEAAVTHGLQAMQVLGGYGYMQEYELERMFRDMKLMTVGGGTNEVHRDMVARHMLGAGPDWRGPARPSGRTK